MKMISVTNIMENVYVLEDRAKYCMNLVVGRDQALIFDTGSGLDDVYTAVREITKLPLIVMNSHGHFDHIGGNYQFDKVYMHKDDFVILKEYTTERLIQWMKELTPEREEVSIPEGFGDWANMHPLDFDRFDLGDMECHILSLKGHSKGSIGVWIPKLRLLLSGDALTPVICLMFQNHLSADVARETLLHVQKIDFDFYLTSHHNKCFPKQMISRLIQCIERSKERKWYAYQYPYPPYTEGKMYVDSIEDEPVALII